MFLDFAPLEGITTAVFRQLHHEYFPGVDRYYTPFLSPTADHRFTPKEQREVLPQYNDGLCVIPQLLTKHAEDFLWAATQLHAMGYKQINLNLGCPSGTVTAKGKGCGMLADLSHLREFLDRVFEKSPCLVSVKTRLGMEQEEEFDAVLDLYKQYPIQELIVHPRVRKDFYRHPVRQEAFSRIYAAYSGPVSYNGSIVTPADFAQCAQKYPKLHSIMIGQALVSDPFLAGKIKDGIRADKQLLREFHGRLFDAYAQQFGSRNNAAKRMKELWLYLICCFEDEQKLGKKVLKAKDAAEFLSVTDKIFRELPLLDCSSGNW